MSRKTNVQYGVESRWTPLLMERGFTAVSIVFLENYALLSIIQTEAMLLIHLISYKWDSRKPFPSFSLLSRRMGLTETAVRNAARSLEKKGLLTRVGRPGRSNQFDLDPLFNKLEMLVEKKKTAHITEG